MNRPRLTKNIVNGLSEVVGLVEADMEGEPDPNRWDDGTWRAVKYLNDLICWHANRKVTKQRR